MLKPVYLYVLYYIIYIHTTYIYVCVCNPSWWSSRIIDLGWRSPWTHDQHWSNVTTLGWMLKGTVIFFIHMFCTLDVQPGFWSPIVYIKYFSDVLVWEWEGWYSRAFFRPEFAGLTGGIFWWGWALSFATAKWGWFLLEMNIATHLWSWWYIS